MLATLLPDLLALVAARLDFSSVERLLASCTALRAFARSDDFYVHLAIQQWGASFWRQARTRRTCLFGSMRSELRQIHIFEKRVRRLGAPLWTEADYAAFWAAEDAAMAP